MISTGVEWLSIELDADFSKNVGQEGKKYPSEQSESRHEGKIFSSANTILVWLEGELQRACVPGR